jgi:hypothetical protein
MSYTDFFLNSTSSVVQLELLEISHPNFTPTDHTYRVVRNATNGVRVQLEDFTFQDFVYYPLKIVSIGSRSNLDSGLRIDLGDLGQVLPKELDAISSASGYFTKPIIVYRTYRNDNLNSPLFGPMILEITTFSFKREGSSFEAKAPSLNIGKVGEFYTLNKFPMLRGFM